MRMPKTTPEETAARRAAMAAANERATMVPFETLKLCARASTLAARIVEIGYVNCLSDGGTGAAMALAGAEGAAMNVLINLSSSKDLPNAAQLRDEAARLRMCPAAIAAAISTGDYAVTRSLNHI